MNVRSVGLRGRDSLGKVAATIKVMPESEETDVFSIKEQVSSVVKGDYYIGNINIEDLAFGLKAIKLVVVMDDKEGLMDKLEQSLRNVKGVGEVEVEEVSLIS